MSKDGKKGVTTPLLKPKQKDLASTTTTSSSTSSNSFEIISPADTKEDDEDDRNDDDDEIRIPLSQVQDMVAKQVQVMMNQWIATQAPHPQLVQGPSKGKDLPALEKLKNFKGETDTDELDLWLKELKRHCTYYEIGGSLDTDAKKLAYAVSHLVGGAEAWWETQKQFVTTYSDFVVAVNARFRSVVDADKAAEELYDLKQKEGQAVTAFADRFMQLLTRVPTMHEEDKMRHFRRGLIAPLQQKVKEQKLKTLNEVIEYAIRMESTFAKKPGLTGKSGLNAVTTEQQPAEQTELLQELINQIKGWKKGPASTSTGAVGPQKDRCWRCGGYDHITDKCSYTTDVCWYCKKPGHIKMECKSLKARQERENKSKPEGSTK